MYSLFVLRGELYGAPLLQADSSSAASRVYRYDGKRFVATGISGGTLLPGAPAGAWGRMVRITPFDGRLAYVAATNSFDWAPVALVVTSTLADARKVTLPDAAALPYDLLVRGATLYVLASASQVGGGYVNHVYATQDLATFHEVLRFASPTFARSFEEAGGDFYFGLGSHYPQGAPHTGELLRVRAAAYAH